MNKNIHYKLLVGAEIEPYLLDIARLRLAVFYDFPYLYQGSSEYELNYLRRYLSQDGAAAILVFDHDEVVGASTCTPLENEDEVFQRPFLAIDKDVSKGFYFAESVLLPDYRGQGIGKGFFRLREDYALSYGPIEFLTFCAVQRAAEHPLCPSGYTSLAPFWQQQGFHPTELISYLSWQDRDVAVATEKPLQFWLKQLK